MLILGGTYFNAKFKISDRKNLLTVNKIDAKYLNNITQKNWMEFLSLEQDNNRQL